MIWSFWYSKKHALHLSTIWDYKVLTVEIAGERKEYTEATDQGQKPSCAVEQGGKFDDYQYLGDASPNTIREERP